MIFPSNRAQIDFIKKHIHNDSRNLDIAAGSGKRLKGVETTMINLEKTLSKFKDRQVVINYYEDEELVKKDGFSFDSIKIMANGIYFIRKNDVRVSIDTDSFKDFVKGDTFKDYFILKNEDSSIEIYFP